jgi:putative DNA primase/helicase
MADGRYFDRKDGLRAYAVANAVRDMGPLLWGPDRNFWAYNNGVWGPAEEVVHGRICRTLADDYRSGHSVTVRDVLRAEVERISVDPVSRYINVANGMLDWSAVVAPDRVPHDHRYLSTVQLPVQYRVSATCSEFDAFLAWAVAPDDVVRVWEIIGYLMMSGNPLQRAVLLTGGGGNGKGVLLEVLTALLGEVNCTSVPLHDFAENRFVTAELFGRLANICGDIDATYIENTSRIKEITGEDKVMGERKGQDPFYFKPWCKMVFSANDIPASSDSSRGWTRRFEIVNFPNTPAAPDRGLKGRLTTPASLSGIAYKAILALRGLMERGDFAHGEARAAANREFAERSNAALRWLGETCEYPVPHADAWTRSSAVWDAFRPWAWLEGSKLHKRGFYALLKQAPGVKFVKRDGVDGFRGFRLRTDPASPLPETHLEPVSGFPEDAQMGLDLGL